MKVVCINDRVIRNPAKDWLTQGKVYELTRPNNPYDDRYWIISNKGKEVAIIKTRFKLLDEVRLEKLEEILK